MSIPGNQSIPLKTICYRGGLLEFRIPASWREEYSDTDGGTFYEDSPNSSTFRLRAITVRTPFPVTSTNGREILAGLRQSSHGIEELSSGAALIRFTESAEESGHKLLITYWIVAGPVPPENARIANFSHTILASEASVPKFQAELELLDREIRAVCIASELGITRK